MRLTGRSVAALLIALFCAAPSGPAQAKERIKRVIQCDHNGAMLELDQKVVENKGADNERTCRCEDLGGSGKLTCTNTKKTCAELTFWETLGLRCNGKAATKALFDASRSAAEKVCTERGAKLQRYDFSDAYFERRAEIKLTVERCGIQFICGGCGIPDGNLPKPHFPS